MQSHHDENDQQHDLHGETDSRDLHGDSDSTPLENSKPSAAIEINDIDASNPLENGDKTPAPANPLGSNDKSQQLVSEHFAQGSMMQLQRMESESDNTPYPPDGIRAWIVVLGSFIAHFTCLGILYSYGIFVVDYQKEFNESRASVTVAYTVSLATFFGVGMVSGRLSDKYGARWIFGIGTVVFVAALVGTSYATSFSEIILCHGFFLGAGTSLCYFPAVSVLPMWFEKRRSLAMGLAVVGSGLGSLFFSVVGQSLFEQHGWRVTLRGTAGVASALLFVAWACLERRLPRELGAGLFGDKTILRDRNYRLLLLGAFFFQFAFMIPYAHVYAYAIGIGITPTDAAAITGSFGIGSAFGRIILSGVGDYCTAIRVMRVSIVIVGIAMLLWPVCTDMGSLLAFAIVYGFFSGGFIASNPVVLADFFGTKRVGSLMGFQNMAMIPGALAGAPVAGYVFDSTGSYTAAAIGGGIVLLLAGLSMFMLDLTKMTGRTERLAKLERAKSIKANALLQSKSQSMLPRDPPQQAKSKDSDEAQLNNKEVVIV